jgi:hypothetical protein
LNADIFFFNLLKKSLHSIVTEIFFKEVKGRKNKLKSVSYFIGPPKEEGKEKQQKNAIIEGFKNSVPSKYYF